MTKIAVLRNPSRGLGFSFVEGQTVEVDTKTAEAAIALGLARLVVEEAPKIKAVPPAPEVQGDAAEKPLKAAGATKQSDK